jgi:chaperone modulatory protein CbpM
MNDLEYRLSLRIDVTVLEVWIREGWVVPDAADDGRHFRDADVARGRLILDLMETMGVNEAGVDVVMELIDQVHGLRGALQDLVEGIAAEDREVQRRILADTERLKRGHF